MRKMHGLSHLPEHVVWMGMKQRCFDPNHKNYHRYGGRGITVHPEWVSDFPAFLAAVGQRPSPKHKIERIDNNKGYEPGNVRWATQREQMANMRRNRIVDGKILKHKAEEVGLNWGTLRSRIEKGVPKEKLYSPEKFPHPRTRNLTYHGRTQSMRAWERETGISRQAIKYRLDAGWPVERALSTPV